MSKLNSSKRAKLALSTIFFGLFALLFLSTQAQAIERNFAGSAQFDYHFVPTQSTTASRPFTLDSFSSEIALKVAVDVSDSFSANIKVCYGCHGFEIGMAYFDYRVSDELNVRVGRFSPSFGAFNIRHDPANHRLSSKPLPYDMGRMLRMREWNLGVLPSPFPDNGIELNGSRWFGNRVQLDYAVYGVSGFKADASATDLDWQQSRSGYIVDNNSRPSVGARTALTLKLGQSSDITLGASGMYGTFDPENKFSYAILGADFNLRFHRTYVRLEYLVRRQQFDTQDPSRFRYAIPASGGDFFVKHGAYVEVEHTISRFVDVMLRLDGLYRRGNVVIDSPFQRRSAVTRWTAGALFNIERGFRIKASTELWDFSDVGPNNRHNEVGVHLGVIGTY